MKGICLLGGPFDGDRALKRQLTMKEPPPALYVVPVRGSMDATQWFLAPVRGAEVYHRGELDEKDWLLYTWRELNLGGGSRREERELVPAGASVGDEPEEQPA